YTPGIWASGVIKDEVNYDVFVGNHFGGASLDYASTRFNTNLVYAGNIAWEPWGKFGSTIEDIEDSQCPLSRWGSTFTYQHVFREPTDTSGFGALAQNPDFTIFRISDGTPITKVGALGPGSQLNSGNTYLYTVDGAVKYRGCSLNAEYFLRWLNDFKF